MPAVASLRQLPVRPDLAGSVRGTGSTVRLLGVPAAVLAPVLSVTVIW